MTSVQLEKRVISGKGILVVPQNADSKKGKIFTLFADVIRNPKNEYSNKTYNPPRSQYANLCFFMGGYLQFVERMEFEKQMWEFQPEGYLQSQYALMCTEAQIRVAFGTVGGTMSASGISAWRHNRLQFDTVKVCCYADTAIQLLLKSTPFDTCVDATDAPPPPPPPPAPAKVPKGTPLGNGSQTPVSDPYSGTDDGGDTVPFPGDNSVAPPPPRTCTTRTVVIRIYEASSSFTLTNPVYGDVGRVEVFNNGDAVGVYSYGVPWAGTGTCSANLTRTTWVGGGGTGRYKSAEIVSITPPQT